jgi:hypothetical protein
MIDRIQALPVLVRIGILVGLSLIVALALLQHFKWSSAYSGSIGLPSEAASGERARMFASGYLWLALLFQVFAALSATSFIRLRDSDLSPLPKYIARFGAAVILTVVCTGVIVKILTLIL